MKIVFLDFYKWVSFLDMGVDYIVHLIVGRMCTPEEVNIVWDKMKQLDRDDTDLEDLTRFETASVENSIFTVFDADGKTKWPVVVFTFGSCYEEFWDRGRHAYHFYVVEKNLYCRGDRFIPDDFIPIRDIPQPHDPRAGLLLIQDIR